MKSGFPIEKINQFAAVLEICGKIIMKNNMGTFKHRGEDTPIASVEVQGPMASIKVNLMGAATSVHAELERDKFYKIDTSRARIDGAKVAYNLSGHQFELHCWAPPVFQEIDPFATQPTRARRSSIADAVAQRGVHEIGGKVLEALDPKVVSGGLTKRDVTIGDQSNQSLKVSVWHNHFQDLERALRSPTQILHFRGVEVSWKDGFGFQGSTLAGGRIDPVEDEDPLRNWWATTGKDVVFNNRSTLDDFLDRAPAEAVPISQVLELDPRGAPIFSTVRASYAAFAFEDFRVNKPWWAKRDMSGATTAGLRVKFRLGDDSGSLVSVGFDAAAVLLGCSKELVMGKFSECADEAAQPGFVALMNKNSGKPFYVRLKTYVSKFLGVDRVEHMIVKAAPAPAPPTPQTLIIITSAGSAPFSETIPADAQLLDVFEKWSQMFGVDLADVRFATEDGAEVASDDSAARRGWSSPVNLLATPVTAAPAPPAANKTTNATAGQEAGSTKLTLTVKALEHDDEVNEITFTAAPTSLHKKFMQAWVNRVGSGAGLKDFGDVLFTQNGKELDPEKAGAAEGWVVGTPVEIWAEPR